MKKVLFALGLFLLLLCFSACTYDDIIFSLYVYQAVITSIFPELKIIREDKCVHFLFYLSLMRNWPFGEKKRGETINKQRKTCKTREVYLFNMFKAFLSGFNSFFYIGFAVS